MAPTYDVPRSRPKSCQSELPPRKTSGVMSLLSPKQNQNRDLRNPFTVLDAEIKSGTAFWVGRMIPEVLAVSHNLQVRFAVVKLVRILPDCGGSI